MQAALVVASRPKIVTVQGAAQWTPATVSPTLWLDASVTASFTESGGKVVTWADQSGHGNDVTQATAGNRPTQTAAILNGRTAVRFSTAMYLAKTGLSASQPISVLIVGTLRSHPDYEGFFDYGVSPATPGPQLSTGPPRGDRWGFYAGTSVDTGVDSDFLSHSYITVYNGASSKFYVDGRQAGGTNGLVNAGTGGGTDFRVGGAWDGNLADVDIAELIVVPAVLTINDIVGFAEYAAAKWAVPDNSPNAGNPPVITAADPPDDASGNSYSYTFTASGDAPQVWAVASGAVPTGLSLSSSTGILSGTISGGAATYTFTVTCTNPVGTVASSTIVMIISAATPTAPTITTTTLPNGTRTVPYSQTLHATGTTPFGWSIFSGALPTSTVIGSTSGIISGTPSAAGSYSFTVKATNTTGNDTQALSITIAELGARQEVAWWGGGQGMDDLIGGTGGLFLSDLSSRGVTRLACSRGAYTTDNPSWLRSEYATVQAALGSVGAGFHLADTSNTGVGAPGNAGVPTTNGQADSIVSTYWTPLAAELVAAGGTFFSIDPEPYGWPSGGGGPPENNPWSTTYTTSAVMTHFGSVLGALGLANGLGFEIYIASNCWWNPSNQYEIALQNGEPSTTFSAILFNYFVHGLVTSGATVNIMDAAFQHPGLPNSAYNDSATQAVDHIVDLTDTEFGAGVVGNNMMVWPWNSETGGVWGHSALQSTVDEATLAGSGSFWIYDGDLPGGYTLADKIAWLDDVKAGLGL